MRNHLEERQICLEKVKMEEADERMELRAVQCGRCCIEAERPTGVLFSDGRNFRALDVRGQRSQRANGESRNPLIATLSSVSEHKTPILTGHFIRHPVFARRDR